VLALLVAVNIALLASGWALVPPTASEAGSGIRIGLVFDIGGKNDKSFNNAAWRGMLRAKAELGVAIEMIEPSEGNDRESALRALAAKGLDLVIGVGFVFGPELERLAVQFPAVHFAGIDYSPGPHSPQLPNLAGLRFRDNEGSFLVGAIAGMLTRSHIVGFIGGMRIPLIAKFEVGYRAGVVRVCPQCTVLVAYAGTDPKAFVDAPLGRELAAAQYEHGADIIFSAAGKTGDGVFAAARQRRMRAIGVDSDQWEMAPCCIITSMIKRVDVAVVDVVKDVIAHRFTGGVRELGLAEHGVGFVTDDHNRDLLPIEVVQRAKMLGDQIIAGTIQVPWQ